MSPEDKHTSLFVYGLSTLIIFVLTKNYQVSIAFGGFALAGAISFLKARDSKSRYMKALLYSVALLMVLITFYLVVDFLRVPPMKVIN